MDIWIAIYNVQMANNIVKWWKTKFLNGYKQFSVECGEGKVSDTEELLGRLSSETDPLIRFKTACTTPPLQPEVSVSQTTTQTGDFSTPKQQIPQHHLNFEEFSCDVAVDNDNRKQDERRQEFSFTLYDFDGHGKITKDDIAGLVTTIYEVLGSSVKVPHYGSKTIQVKLTISPDQSLSATILNSKGDGTDEKPAESRIRYKKDLNVTIRQGINEKRRHCKRQSKRKTSTLRKQYCCNNKREEFEQENLFLSDDNSDDCSRISENLTTEEEEDEEEEDVECSSNGRSKPRKFHKKCRKGSGHLIQKDNKLCGDNICPKTKKKKRSGSLQRQELLEIIQANMDKNNLNFQSSRKHSSHGVSPEDKQCTVEDHRYGHNKSQKMTSSTLQYLAKIVDPTHFYVDLAALQNTTQFSQNECQYDKLIDAVMCVSNKKISLHRPSKCKNNNNNYNRGIKTGIPFQYQQFLQYSTNDEFKNKLNKKLSKKSINSEVKNLRGNPHVATGHTSSPHHLRHRNRQEDQARAMAQVVRWLEQEFSNNFSTKDKCENTNHNSNNFNSHSQNQNHNHQKHNSFQEKTTSHSTSNSGVERHEHHHMHEHIHHHYYHYQETPLVV